MGAGHAEQPAAVRVRQLEERVLAAGLATDAELDAVLARLYADASPLNGARIVARAWSDPGYAAGSSRTATRPRPSWASISRTRAAGTGSRPWRTPPARTT